MRQLIIAFSDPALAQKIKALLQNHGLTVSAVCNSGAQVLQVLDRFSGGLLVCPWRLPDHTAAGLIELLPEDYDVLTLVTSQQGAATVRPGLFPLSQPFQAAVLIESIRQLLLTRQLSYTALADLQNKAAAAPAAGRAGERRNHSEAPTRSAEDQKIIEQAKYILMNRRQMSEAQAHRYLQKKSMESGIRLVDLARQYLQ